MPREDESDQDFIARVQAFTENIADLSGKMDTASLEESMYQANSEGLLIGISSRLSQAREIVTRRRRKYRAKLNL